MSVTNWLRSNWLDALLAALVALVEAATVAPWAQLLLRDTALARVAHAPAGMFVIGLAAFWAARAMLAGGWELATARAVSLALWLALTVIWFGVVDRAWLAAPLALLDGVTGREGLALGLLALGGLATWRGLMLGSDPSPFTADMIRRVALRGVALTGLALLAATFASATTARRVEDVTSIALPALLVGALVAAAATQVRATRRRARSAADRAAGAGWLGAAALAAVGILAIALIVAGIAGRDVWARVLGPLAVALGALGTVGLWVLIAFAYVVFLLLTPLIWLIRHVVGHPGAQQTPTSPAGPPNLDRFSQDAHQALPGALRVGLEIGVVSLVALLALWLVLRSLRRYRSFERDAPEDEVRESVWSRDLLRAQLRAAVHGLRPTRRGARRGLAVDLGGEPVDVRDAYRHVLALAARTGQGRARAETPLELSRRLDLTWPAATQPLDDLTERYLHVRYGESQAPDDAEHARAAWAAILNGARPRPPDER